MLEYIKTNPLDEKIRSYNYNVELNLMRLKHQETVEELNKYKRMYNELNDVSESGKKITSSLNIEETLKNVCVQVKSIINFDIIEIALYNEKTSMLEYSLYYNSKNDICTGSVMMENDKFIEVCCFKNKREIIRDLADNELHMSTFSSIQEKEFKIINSVMCFPLTNDNKIIGIFNIETYNKTSYSLSILEKLRILVSYISIAAKNIILFNNTRYSAEHDLLTDILNRKEILIKGEENCRTIREKDDKFSLVMFDIDNFKKVNDIYGHNIGDVILKNISRIAKSSIRKSDFIGRYGGEEFLMVLPKVDLDGGISAAERLRKSIESYKYKIDEKKYINVTISLGVYEFNYKNRDFSEGMKKVDKALYAAKNSGRNKCIKYIQQ